MVSSSSLRLPNENIVVNSSEREPGEQTYIKREGQGKEAYVPTALHCASGVMSVIIAT